MRITAFWFVLFLMLAGNSHGKSTTKPESIRIALLHLNPVLGDVEHNTQTLMRAMTLAKAQGADWVMTPELSLTGYKFMAEIGTDWITTGPDQYVQQLRKHADQLNVVLLLSHLEKTTAGNIFNTLFVVNRQGEIMARHRKINTIPDAESWSTPGDAVAVVNIDGITTGLLICADAWPKDHARELKAQGAELLLSSANWPPGEYGPGSSWLDRSREAGLPVIVNNRTGKENGFDMHQGESVIVIKGEQQFAFADTEPHLIVFDWYSSGRLSNVKVERLNN